MPFTDGNDLTPEPTAIPSTPPTYSPPTNTDMAAVAITVSVVGIFMFVLITWLAIRLRRSSASSQTGFSPSHPIYSRPTSNISTLSNRFRPSFAPSEASSRFGFTRKPLHLSHQHDDGSWDFADSDPSKEKIVEKSTLPKHRPAPISTPTSPNSQAPLSSPRGKRSSTYKDEFGPRTPSTPGTPFSSESIEPPPPAYCKDGSSWSLYHPKDLPPC